MSLSRLLMPILTVIFVSAIRDANNGLRASLLLVGQVPEFLCDRQMALRTMTAGLVRTAREDVTLLTTTSGTFTVRHPWYFGVDAGLAYAPAIGEIFPYAGINMYFRPVNKNAPLGSLSGTVGRRLSIMIGYTWTDNLLKSDQRAGLFARNTTKDLEAGSANAMMVLGLGLRLTDSLRTTVGGVVFKQLDPNPLIPHAKLRATPFFSLSWDWDAVATIKAIGRLLGVDDIPAGLQP